jgi:hypothetical protein
LDIWRDDATLMARPLLAQLVETCWWKTATVRRFAMNPWQASARFAAFVWYLNRDRQTPPDEAARLAKDNWIAFLPYADERVGRLLVTEDPAAKAVREERRRDGSRSRKQRIALVN